MSFYASANNYRNISLVQMYVLAGKTVKLVSAHVASDMASVVTIVVVMTKMKMRCLVMTR